MSKVSKDSVFRAAQTFKMAVFGLQNQPKLISREIRVAEKQLNFHIVYSQLGCLGLYWNKGTKIQIFFYIFRTLVDSQMVSIHPSSALFHRQPEWVVYHEVVQTTKEYMREVTAIDPKWLVEFAPAFFKFSDPTKLSNFKKNQRIEPLYNKYEEHKDAWRISRTRKRRNQIFT